MGEVLTASVLDELQADVRNALNDDEYGDVSNRSEWAQMVECWYDSHEALRARAAELEGEVERLTKMLAVFEESAVEAVKDAKRLEKERDEAIERHRFYSIGIANAIGPDRARRDTGEPARPDYMEVIHLHTLRQFTECDRQRADERAAAAEQRESAAIAAFDHERGVSSDLRGKLMAAESREAGLREALGEVLESSKWMPYPGSQSGGEFLFVRRLLSPGCLARAYAALAAPAKGKGEGP